MPWIEPPSLATLLVETAGFLAKGSRDVTDSQLPGVSHLVSRVVELFSSVCSDTITIFEVNSHSYFKSFYVSLSRKHMLWSTALRTQMFEGNERTVFLFGMSCDESYMWFDNISRHSGCRRAMKKLSSGPCVGMNEGTSTWRRVYWPDSIATGETHTNTHILLFSWSSGVPSISILIFVFRWSG